MPDSRNQLLAKRLMANLLPVVAPQSTGTYLQPDQEAAYRQWMNQIGHTYEQGFEVSPQYSGNNYDYRGFYSKYGAVPLDAGQHLTDEYKLPSHPTFSDESIYAKGRAAPYAGSWHGEYYTPSAVVQAMFGKRPFESK